MTDQLQKVFLDYSATKLRQLTTRIETCVGKLNATQIWTRSSENENAPGNLILHLTGNVRQWIISGVGGAADHRERDAEFNARSGAGSAELAARLRATVEEAAEIISRQTAAQLERRITVQNYELTVFEAIYHVVEHFAGHTGQIIFVTKFMTGEDMGFYGHLRTTAPHTEKTP